MLQFTVFQSYLFTLNYYYYFLKILFKKLFYIDVTIYLVYILYIVDEHLLDCQKILHI